MNDVPQNAASIARSRVGASVRGDGAEKQKGCAETSQRGVQGEIVISLPLPPKECHQNRSGRTSGWRDAAEATKEARQFAYCAVLAMRAESGPRFWPEVGLCAMDVLFRFPDHRRRDLANYLGACKAYLDGFADANVYRDDALIVDMRVRRSIDKANPGVTFTIRQVE